jgi:hypothetical protein
MRTLLFLSLSENPCLGYQAGFVIMDPALGLLITGSCGLSSGSVYVTGRGEPRMLYPSTLQEAKVVLKARDSLLLPSPSPMH